MNDAIIQFINRVKAQPPVDYRRLRNDSQIESFLDSGISVKGSMVIINITPPLVFPCFTIMGQLDKVKQFIPELSSLFSGCGVMFAMAIRVCSTKCPEVVKTFMTLESEDGGFARYAFYDDLLDAFELHRQVEAELGPPSEGLWDCTYTLEYVSYVPAKA